MIQTQVCAPDWSNRAVCRDQDPELFFPVGESIMAKLQMEEARAVCQVCPVTTVCLEFAIKTRTEFGMWGGKAPVERQRLARRIEVSRLIPIGGVGVGV